MLRLPFLVAAGITLAAPGTVRAHDSRPLVLELTEVEGGVFSVEWRVPPSVPAFNIPEPVLPEGCFLRGAGIAVDRRDGFYRKKFYAVPGGLAGQEIGLQYPVLNPSISTLVRIRFLNGQKHSKLLAPDEMTWRVPDRETGLGVARDYTLLGIRHILGGVDHLLFLVCLILVAGTGRRILITVTGFTLAHSLTLALSALHVVRLPIIPVEATIALSIVFLASEIARGKRGSLTYRYPIAVSSSFGLLHGFGFAAVLRDIGLPQTELLTSLLFFNVGVEIGQVLFLVGLLVAYRALVFAIQVLHLQIQRHPNTSLPGPGLLTRLEKPAVYAVGSLAAMWLIERVSLFWL